MARKRLCRKASVPIMAKLALRLHGRLLGADAAGTSGGPARAEPTQCQAGSRRAGGSLMRTQRDLARQQGANGQGNSYLQVGPLPESRISQDCRPFDAKRDRPYSGHCLHTRISPNYLWRLSEGGLEAAARRAGVGIGILYRHFPPERPYTRWSTGAKWNSLSNWPSIPRQNSPGRGAAPLAASRRRIHGDEEGHAAALTMAAHGSLELVVYSLDRLTKALAELLQRAVAAGEICADSVDVLIDGLGRRPDKRDDRQAGDALPYVRP